MEKIDDVFERLRHKAMIATGQGSPPRLLPDRHPTRDFFIADILDWALKDDRHSMEHPMFSLAKTPDHKIRRYEHNGIAVTIAPSAYGLATIWDKDILIYAVSQLVEGINRGRPVSRVVRLTAYDLLVATNRHTGGGDYDQLVGALRRLKGMQIETNITTNGQRARHGFGLLEEWRIVEKSPNNGRMVALELVLSEWLYRAILGREVLTLNRDYFRLSGGLERRLYELARKHCGHQSRWTISLPVLHTKSGAASVLFRFRQMIKAAVDANALPDYTLTYDSDSDQLTFRARARA
jgi:plasmid replication initiation protein